MNLRPYQKEAVDAVYQALRDREDNPCVVLPTGTGKSVVIAKICTDAVQRWQGRVLILAHVKELLEQNADKIRILGPSLDVGVYSAGLKRRETQHSVIVAGIQSVYKRACELDAFDIVLVDESHLLPPDGEGMYRQFFKDALSINPKLRVIGFTATPFRLKSGLICGPDNILNHVCYEAGIKEMIAQGYLSPLITKAGKEKVDTPCHHIRAGEFISGEVEELMDTDQLVEATCQEIVSKTADRKSVLIFGASVAHGRHLASVISKKTGQEVGTVFGDTLPFMRYQTLTDFREGQLKYLVNVNVLTTGFDAPNIDCVAMVRPTLSPGAYVQMVGRGFRLHPGKENCIVLDFGDNILRHGPVDAIRIKDTMSKGNGEAPAKECPSCQSVIAAGYAVCPDCGYEFPPPDRQQHGTQASKEGILSGETTVTEHDVLDVGYAVHRKRGAPEDAPTTMRVEYRIGLNHYQSEWVCFDHSGWARQKAESWWRLRSDEPVPASTKEAVDKAFAGALRETKSITVKSITGEQFDSIIGYELAQHEESTWHEDIEVPF